MAATSLKKKLVILLAASGLYAAGNITPGIFAFDFDESPPTLELEKTGVGRVGETDVFWLKLPFDRPVSLLVYLEWVERKKSDPAYIVRRNELFDYRDGVAKDWYLWHPWRTPVPWKVLQGPLEEIVVGDYVIQPTRLRVEATSIGGTEMDPVELVENK